METQTDIEEIQNLIKQIIESENRGRHVIHELSIKLDDYGPDIVDPILSELYTHKTEGKFPDVGKHPGISIYYLVFKAAKFAEPQHAMKLAKTLIWPEFIFNIDRSIRCNLIEALKRIGNISVVPLLEEYAEKVKQVVYSDQEGRLTAKRLHEVDQQKIADAIKSCKQRPDQ